jgi:ureidoacrylate peracid hydrolase
MKPLDQLLQPEKTAIVVVDMQNDFCHPEGACGQAGMDTTMAMELIPRLQRLLEAAREFGTHVIFIQCIHEDCTDSSAWLGRHGAVARPICRKDTWGADFIGVAPLPGEPVVIKHRYSAFIHTRLESVLHTLKVENLILTGVGTNVCVESTARQGYMLDYNIVFTSDCTGAATQEAHDTTLENMRKHFGVVASANQIIDVWTKSHAVTIPV